MMVTEEKAKINKNLEKNLKAEDAYQKRLEEIANEKNKQF